MTHADKKGEIVESRFSVQLESVHDGSGFRLLKDKIAGLMNRRIQDYDPSSYGNGENMEEDFEESSHAVIYNGGRQPKKDVALSGIGYQGIIVFFSERLTTREL